MFTIIIFISVLAVLVLSHEFGHFIVARKNGITVDEFGFGFPPRIIGIRRITASSGRRWQIIWRHKQLEDTIAHHTGTLYSINLIPLGGFVRIKGENPTDVGAFEPDSFVTKKTWQKACVLIAGVAMNVLVAALLLSIGFMVGMPDVSENAHGTLRIMQVFNDKPASAAGLAVGDTIIKVEALENLSVTEFQKYVNEHRDTEIAFTVERAGKQEVKKIRPTIYEDTGKAGIGVALMSIGIVRYPWYQAIWEGIKATGQYFVLVVLGFWQLVTGLFHGTGVGGEVTGPVGVAVMTGEAARLGFAYLLQFTALLSLNLAVLNILPIPALDGGRLLFVFIGRIFKRSLAPQVEQIIHSVGFVLLMGLVLVVTVKDIGVFRDIFITWWRGIF